MPYAENGGVRIHYLDEGEGHPLVLQHGYSVSSEWWVRLGYVDALCAENRVIVPDLRGHNLSDKPHDPEAYRYGRLAGDVVAVLDALGIGRAHFMGYSKGGAVGWSMVRYHPDRLISLIAGGSFATEDDPGTIPAYLQERIDRCLRGYDAWIEESKQRLGPRWRPEIAEMIRAADLDAYIAMLPMHENAGLEEAARGITIPCLMYAGAEDEFYDRIKATAEFTPGARFVTFPGLDHGGTFTARDLVLPHVLEFLADVEAMR